MNKWIEYFEATGKSLHQSNSFTNDCLLAVFDYIIENEKQKEEILQNFNTSLENIDKKEESIIFNSKEEDVPSTIEKKPIGNSKKK